jgi:eukaryotic-like serine/threonine-protein kinase
MYLGERYQIDTTEHSILRIPEGQQPAKPLFPGAIGVGSTAVVYRGTDRQTGKAVAIKVLREEYATDERFIERFQREAKIAMEWKIANIVQVYDYGLVDGNYFMVMELFEGTDLRRYLRSRGVLDAERAVIIAHDLALGLGAAHRRGIVYGNLSTQNILIGRFGEIKLTSSYGVSLGHEGYYAPEQARGEIVSPPADVYALGIVMYEMLTGRTPFDGDTPVQHIHDQPVPPSRYNPNIPPALEKIIMRCLEKVPERRFRDGSQLARALESL